VPKITPFCGIHYDPLRTYGLSPVIGPPQDLPDLDEASRLIEQHPYHSLRLELGNPEAGEWTAPDRVRTSVFEEWIESGVLVRPDKPAFFVHEHRYRQDGIYHRRLGLFAAASLDDSEASGFRPHEGTIPGNLRFRVDLLRQLRLSISPIFTIIRDSGWLGVVLADLVHARPPDLSGNDVEEGIHRVWTLTDPHLITWLQDLVEDRPIYIADGHHRFAAAKAYRDHLVEQGRDPGLAANVLTLIVSEFDPGVSILPIHREIRSIPGGHETLQSGLEELFEVECILKPHQIDPDLVARRARRLTDSPSEQPEFLAICHDDQRLCRLKLKPSVSIDSFVDESTAPEVRELDVTVLHRVILEHILKIPADDPDNLISYSADAAAMTRHVQDGQAAMAIFMSNPRIEQVMAVADAGTHMPQKSTYFYPKVPAGLVMYDLG
jgi:uncharacterized protein (DUF1015 family)